MNTTELVNRVKEAVKDGSFSDSDILGHLNRCLQDTAFEVCLPGLQADDEVSFAVGEDFASLPDDYSHDLWHVEPLTKTRRINLHTSLHSLQRLYQDTDEGGQIKDAASDGASLHVRPKLTQAQDVRVHYYRAPEGLVLADDDPVVVANEPEGIPSHLHDKILVSYAAMQIFSIIEDGVDGAKTNTSYWRGQYEEGMEKLRSLPAVKSAPKFAPYVKRHARFF